MALGHDKLRNLAGVALGVLGLLLCRHYTGPGAALLHAHGANLTFSFGAFYILKLTRLPRVERGRVCAAYALTGVCAQEIAQGLSLYPGVFDPLDFVANAAGIALAWTLAAATAPALQPPPHSQYTVPPSER